MVTNAGIAPFGTMGLRKPPGSLLLVFLFSLLASAWTPRTCDLPRENAVFKKRLSIQPPVNEKTSSKNTNNDFGLLLKKQKLLLASLGRCPLHSAFVTEQGAIVRLSEQWTQKHFQACKRRDDSPELANKTTLTSSLRNRGSRGQSTKGRARTRETTV